MMVKAQIVQSLPELLRHLANSLYNVFDPHGVCATLASELSSILDLDVIVAITSDNQSHFDVWIGNSGRTRQQQWPAEDQALNYLSEHSELTMIPVSDFSLTNSMIGQMRPMASMEIVSVPFPYPQRTNYVMGSGVICVVSSDPSRQLCSLLEMLTTHASPYIDRAFLRRRSAQQEAEFAIISDIANSLTSTLNLEMIVDQLSGDVRKAMAVESISIGLIDSSGERIVFDEAPGGQTVEKQSQVSLDVGEGIAGWVAAHGKSAISNNVPADERFAKVIDEVTGLNTKSVLCIPLKVGEKVIGVLRAVNKQNGRFDDDDSRLLQAIGGPLAIAIENARLHSSTISEKRRIEHIFASMSESLILADQNTRIISTNDAFLTLLGLEKNDVLGRPVINVLATSVEQFNSFIEQVKRQTNGFSQLHCRVGKSKGTGIPVLIGGTLLSHGPETAKEYIFVISDLRQLMEVERMRDDFFHNIVHELRTPLASILLYARLLREGRAKEDYEKAERFLNIIERESDRLQKLVRQMLQLAKLESKTDVKISSRILPGPVIDQVLQPLSDQATEKGLSFEIHVAPNLPPIKASEEALYVILKNLVENSVKFTSSGTVSVTVGVDGSYLRIDVADEGIGISSEAIPHVFQRFYRAKSAVDKGIAGSGLGLYMVKETIEHLTGRIIVDSQLGNGSTFTVLLPIAANDIPE